MHSMRLALAGALCGMVVTSAAAHDTWFEPLPAATAAGGVAFALGTGNRFPVHEFPLYREHLASTGCRSAAGEVVPLRPLQDRPNAIWLRATVKPAAQPTCWAQVLPVEVTLGAGIVELYLKEVNAPASVRETWAAQRARGVPWTERYAKHARVEVLLPGAAVATQPVPMAMDVLLHADAPVAVDRTLTFQVLRDGQPLAGLAVELQNHTTPIGFWRLTDAEGRVSFAPPLPGRWLLRGTELRLAPAQPDVWESRFITLAFDVPPPSGR